MNHVLIVIDLIEDYFDASIWPNSVLPAKRGSIMASVNDLTRMCRGHGIPIVWIRQEFAPDFSNAFLHARREGRRYAISGRPGSQLARELEVRPGEAVWTKTRFSAFYGTAVDDFLSESNVSTVILAGITTAWCVRSTAVDAYQRDYDVILASDCTAAFDETSHRESLTAMDGYIASCMTNAEVADYLDSLKQTGPVTVHGN